MIKFNYVADSSKPHVICDTNIWYELANGTIENSDDVFLIPTSLTLYEIATSPVMAYDLSLYQKTINSLKKYGKQIIPTNPFDFILQRHDPNFQVDSSLTKIILAEFTEVLRHKIPDGAVMDEEAKKQIIERSQENRKMTDDFADFGTNALIQIRKNINLNTTKAEHLTENTEQIVIDMLKSILTDYVKDMKYEIDFENFNWDNLELFIRVTESYFKKLEITKGMTIKRNDAVDWLNMLYVRPNDKYLTYEKTWRDFIENDTRISHYLFK